MRKCKKCEAEYKLWAADGSGLCTECQKIKAKEQKTIEAERSRKEKENAKDKLQKITCTLLPGELAKAYGLAFTSSMGSSVGNIFQLWCGRFFLGILGDMLHVDTHKIALVVVTDSKLFLVSLGEHPEIAPSFIVGFRTEQLQFKEANLEKIQCTYDVSENRLVLKGDIKAELKFPRCFLEDNILIPKHICQWIDKKQVPEDIEDDVSEEAICAACKGIIPVGKTECENCGWSY